jgi:hypothetical protein
MTFKSARFINASRRLIDKVRDPMERKHSTAHGIVSSVSRSESGQVTRVNVTLPNGTALPPLEGGGLYGLGEGARVELDVTGTKAFPAWKITRVIGQAVGTPGTGAGDVLSTPVHAFLETSVTLARAGSPVVNAEFGFYLIDEQWRHRQAIAYEVEVRNASTFVRVFHDVTQFYRRVGGALKTAINAAATTIEVQSNGEGLNPYAEFDHSNGIGLIGDELFRYESTDEPGAYIRLLNCTRGFASTTAVSHSVNDEVTWRGMSLTIQGLDQDVAYEAHVRAINANGNASNWSAWETFTSEIDITAPSWSGITVGLSAAPTVDGMRVTWNPADQDYADLDRYEIQESVDGTTWGTIHRVGDTTSWDYPALSGTQTFFRIRAVDTTGNEGSWSSSVRGAADGGVIYGNLQNLLTNGDFPSNITGWTISESGSTDTVYLGTKGYKALGCMSVEIVRAGGSEFWSMYQDVSGLTAGDILHAIVYVARTASFDEVFDEMQLHIQSGSAVGRSPVHYGGFGTTQPKIAVIDGGRWTKLEAKVQVPAGSTTARFSITAEHNLLPLVDVAVLYIDDAQLYVVNTTSDPTTVELNSTKLAKASNLSDLTNAGTARTNLGLGDVATRNVGTIAGTAAAGEYAGEIVTARGGRASLDARLDEYDQIVARASTNTARAQTNGSNLLCDFEDVDFDPNSFITTGGSWKFQPTIAGYYRITASIQVTPSAAWGAGTNFVQIGITKGASAVAFGRAYAGAAVLTSLQVGVSDIVHFNGTTDLIYITMAASWTTLITAALSGDNRMNFVAIERI